MEHEGQLIPSVNKSLEQLGHPTNDPRPWYKLLYMNFDLEPIHQGSGYKEARAEEIARRQELPSQLKTGLCLRPSEIADVYLLSLAPKVPKEQQDNLDKTLEYEKYRRLDDLAAKHLLSGITWLITRKAPQAVYSLNQKGERVASFEYIKAHQDIEQTFESIIKGTMENKKPAEILSKIPVDRILNVYYIPGLESTELDRGSDERAYMDFAKALQRLNEARYSGSNSQTSLELLTALTYFHNTIHHSGGTTLEELLDPDSKNKAYDLLFRFNSTGDNGKFATESVKKFSSPEARVLFGKLSRQAPPFDAPSVPKEYSPDEEARYLADEFLQEQEDRSQHPKEGERKEGEFLIRAVIALRDYPIFKTVYPLFKKYGDIDPIEFIFQLKHYSSNDHLVSSRFMEDVLKRALQDPNKSLDEIMSESILNYANVFNCKVFSRIIWFKLAKDPDFLGSFGPKTRNALKRYARSYIHLQKYVEDYNPLESYPAQYLEKAVKSRKPKNSQ